MSVRLLKFKDFSLLESIYLDREEGKNISDDAFKKMRASIFWLNGKYPFFSSLISRLMIRENRNLRFRTMATDGLSIHYDPGFVLGKTEEEIIWTIAHEVMHNALCHFARAPKDQDKSALWNVAADYAINQMLTPIDNSGGSIKPSTSKKDCVGQMPSGSLYPGCGYVKGDEQFINMSAEDIYKYLIKIGFNPDDLPKREDKPKPPLGPPEVPKVGDIIFDPATGNYGVVNSVDESNDEIDYDPIPKDKVSEYLRRKMEAEKEK